MQMTAVCVEAKVPGKKKTEKRYRVPTKDELALADIQEEDIEEVFDGIPYGASTSHFRLKVRWGFASSFMDS